MPELTPGADTSARHTITPPPQPADAPAEPSRVETVPGTPSALARASSRPPGAVPTSVQLVDRLGDIVGVIAVAVLCGIGRISGELAVVAIGAILGVGIGLRQAGARAGAAAGLGLTGLALLSAAQLAPYAAAAIGGVARARGVVTLCLALVLAVGGVGCSGGAAAAGSVALKTGVAVLEGARWTRRYVCSRALDPILGDPRAEVAPSSGGDAPVPAAPAPAPPPAPAAPVLLAPPAVLPPRADDAPPATTDAAVPAGLDAGL